MSDPNNIISKLKQDMEMDLLYTSIKYDGLLQVLEKKMSMRELYRQLEDVRTQFGMCESRDTLKWHLSSSYREVYPERVDIMIAKAKTEELILDKKESYNTSWRTRGYGGSGLYLKDLQQDYEEILNEHNNDN